MKRYIEACNLLKEEKIKAAQLENELQHITTELKDVEEKVKQKDKIIKENKAHMDKKIQDNIKLIEDVFTLSRVKFC